MAQGGMILYTSCLKLQEGECSSVQKWFPNLGINRYSWLVLSSMAPFPNLVLHQPQPAWPRVKEDWNYSLQHLQGTRLMDAVLFVVSICLAFYSSWICLTRRIPKIHSRIKTGAVLPSLCVQPLCVRTWIKHISKKEIAVLMSLYPVAPFILWGQCKKA